VSCRKWTDPELIKLEQLVGELPFPLLMKTYNNWAKVNGFLQRSEKAIRARTVRSELSVCCVGDYLTRKQVALLTGTHADRISRIIRDRQLKVMIYRSWQYLRRRDLIAAAREHPEDWYGVDRAGLFALFEDEDLADDVAARAARPPWPAGPRAVRCLTTNKVYATVSEAATAARCASSTVWRSAEIGSATRWGQRWEWV
jgi:hypothetical protein